MKTPIVKVSPGTAVINADAMTQRLTLLSKNIVAARPTSVTGAATTLEALQQPALLALAKKDPALKSQLASITKQTKAALKDAQAKETAYRSALASMLQSAIKLLKP